MKKMLPHFNDGLPVITIKNHLCAINKYYRYIRKKMVERSYDRLSNLSAAVLKISDGDGIGDLKGITSKTDLYKSLNGKSIYGLTQFMVRPMMIMVTTQAITATL